MASLPPDLFGQDPVPDGIYSSTIMPLYSMSGVKLSP